MFLMILLAMLSPVFAIFWEEGRDGVVHLLILLDWNQSINVFAMVMLFVCSIFIFLSRESDGGATF